MCVRVCYVSPTPLHRPPGSTTYIVLAPTGMWWWAARIARCTCPPQRVHRRGGLHRNAACVCNTTRSNWTGQSLAVVWAIGGGGRRKDGMSFEFLFLFPYSFDSIIKRTFVVGGAVKGVVVDGYDNVRACDVGAHFKGGGVVVYVSAWRHRVVSRPPADIDFD